MPPTAPGCPRLPQADQFLLETLQVFCLIPSFLSTLRGVFEGTGDARTIRPLGRQDSSMLKAFSDAQGLIIRPPHAPALQAGDMVSVLVLPDGL